MPLSSLPAQPSSRRVLVTGAASGLGLALASGLAARGDQVLATDIATDRPGSIPAGVEYVTLDVRSDEAWARVREHVQETWGGLDVLINNAGIATGGRIDVATMEEWHRVVDINLLGVVRGCRTFTPVFKAQGSGHIVNTASLAGLVHAPGMASYNAVKAGVVAISETLDHELAAFGINVSVICPAFFRTNLGASFAGADTDMESAGKAMLAKSPRSADEVAAIVIKGIDAHKSIILTDRDGQIAWRAKRFARPMYTRMMRKAGARLKEGRAPASSPADILKR